MPYAVDVESYTDYLFFRWAGPATYVDVVDAWKRVAEQCKSQGIWKALVETKYETYLSTMEIFDIASSYQDLGFDSRFKVAHVFLGNEPEDLRRFGEDVAANRGADVKVFSDIKRAKAWLLEREGI